MVNCDGCTACCRWGDMADKIMPKDPNIEADEKGNCVHLGVNGCKIYGTDEWPEYCKTFDCTTLLRQVEADPFMRVLTVAVLKRQEMEQY